MLKVLGSRQAELFPHEALKIAAKEAEAAPAGAVPFVLGEATAALSIAEFIDLAAEKARLNKDIASFAGDIERTAKKLGNPDFVARARDHCGARRVIVIKLVPHGHKLIVCRKI